MGWKNLPTWLKGGIMGLISIIVLAGINSILNNVTYSNILLLLDFLYYLIIPFVDSTPGLGEWLLHIYTVWFSYIIIGAVIGFIVGKIRGK